jgi:hypothetical protein
MARASMANNGVEIAVLRPVNDDIAYASLVARLFAQLCLSPPALYNWWNRA